MPLTSAQQLTLKAWVLSNGTLNQLPPSNSSAAQIRDVLNALDAGPFVLWRSNVPLTDINNAIVWANMTPAQAIPTTGSDAQLLWIAKSAACQGKQFNLQTLLYTYAGGVDARLANVRAALQDCLTFVPSKNDGTTQSAGWANVQTAMQRNATVLEKILATGTGTTGSPAIASFEGAISYEEVSDAMGWVR